MSDCICAVSYIWRFVMKLPKVDSVWFCVPGRIALTPWVAPTRRSYSTPWAWISAYLAVGSMTVFKSDLTNLWIKQFTAVQVAGFLDWWSTILLKLNLLDRCLTVKGILLMFVRNMFMQAKVLNLPFWKRCIVSCRVGCSVKGGENFNWYI